MKGAIRGLLGCVAVVLAVGVSAAEIKRWVDAEGRVHFGDQAPPTAEAEVQLIEDKSAPSTAGGGLRPGEREMLEQFEERGRKLEAAKQRSAREYEQRRISADEAKKRRARCDYYRNRLDNYLSRKRHGYARGEGDKINSQIKLYEMKTQIYCD